MLEAATLTPLNMVAQEYELVPTAKMREHPANPHVGDVATISESIAVNGFYGAVYLQRSTGYIVAGNHRYRAAVAAGAKELPAIWLDISDETARKILIVDNRSAELGMTDEGLLRALLKEIPDLAGTGYDLEDLDRMAADAEHAKRETVFDQSVQPTPNREYVLILADSLEEWETVRAALNLTTVRRGGYKAGSIMDHTGPARVAKAKDFLRLIGETKESKANGNH
jgi:hypothetical protein